MAARADLQNLDSLLDTMANVVGILVVLVAVTQLSVGDAVERISSRHTGAELATPEALAEARARAGEIEAALADASGKLAAFAPTAARPGWLLDELRPHVEQLEALEGRFDAGADPSDAARALAEQSAALREREQAVATAEARLKGLDALLAEVPPETRPKLARLPDPRPPPAGAQEVSFLVRYGRVARFDLPTMTKVLAAGVRDALGDNRAVGPDDRPWLANLFAKRAYGAGSFTWSIRDADETRSFFADVVWIDRMQGESRAEIARGDSAFAREIAALEQTGRFLRFYVWSDSYEAYLEARYAAEALGWEVSWMVVEPEQEVGINLLGGSKQRILLD